MTSITIVSGDAAYNAANLQPTLSWRNLLAEGTITDSLLPASNPRANAVSVDTVSFWGPTGAATLRASMGGTETAGIAFVAAHNMGTEGRTLTVERNSGGWSTIGTVAPADDQPFALIFPDTTGTDFGFAVDGACQIGIGWIGPRVTPACQVAAGYVPLSGARAVELLGGIGRTGHFLGRRRLSATAELSATLTPLERTYLDGTLASFMTRYRDGRPFIWAPAPGAVDEVAYVWASQGRVGQSIQGGGVYVDLTLQMQAFAAA